ncbi:hypothetical protein AUJ66_05570 [Candidatus Desantisbacteria bacterium CG1_02_38_46]|uniref:Ion-translocating oxidoreductase complex subunit G n=2 Tax=unclassified Candidatus Desantisiibacteriota TaxID=3106372 RepID=A0A1J4SDB9_9BACT|nr:MAG: hypothetical protein AUJ66_05570 [Candidatus Desantisbacteria bacterium CG1_02_38_46]
MKDENRFIGTLKSMSLLIIICVVSAAGLSVVYDKTRVKIGQQVINERMESLKEVLPGATEFKEFIQEKKWAGYKNGKFLGNVIMVSAKGYAGNAEILVGTDIKNSITNIKILRHSETPGLGAKISENKFTSQFTGKKKSEMWLKKDNSDGKIDAITAATISSRAVTNAIRNALSETDILSESKKERK